MGYNHPFCYVCTLNELHSVSTTCEALFILFTFSVSIIFTTVVKMGWSAFCWLMTEHEEKWWFRSITFGENIVAVACKCNSFYLFWVTGFQKSSKYSLEEVMHIFIVELPLRQNGFKNILLMSHWLHVSLRVLFKNSSFIAEDGYTASCVSKYI